MRQLQSPVSEEPPSDKYSTGTAFLLWLACAVGLCGLHRIYLGRTFTGVLYMLTFGLFGVGQIVDLLRLRGLVADENLKDHALQALAEKRALAGRAGQPALTAGSPPVPLRIELARSAARHGGKLSIATAVVETGHDFAVVEAALDQMAKEGYVDIDNSESGALLYVFRGLGE